MVQVKEALIRNCLVLPEGDIQPVSKKSYANRGYDKLLAWAARIVRSNMREAAKVAWQVWRYFSVLKPCMGFLGQLSGGKSRDQVMLEFTTVEVSTTPCSRTSSLETYMWHMVGQLCTLTRSSRTIRVWMASSGLSML